MRSFAALRMTAFPANGYVHAYTPAYLRKSSPTALSRSAWAALVAFKIG